MPYVIPSSANSGTPVCGLTFVIQCFVSPKLKLSAARSTDANRASETTTPSFARRMASHRFLRRDVIQRTSLIVWSPLAPIRQLGFPFVDLLDRERRRGRDPCGDCRIEGTSSATSLRRRCLRTGLGTTNLRRRHHSGDHCTCGEAAGKNHKLFHSASSESSAVESLAPLGRRLQKSTCPPILNNRPASTAVGRRN